MPTSNNSFHSDWNLKDFTFFHLTLDGTLLDQMCTILGELGSTFIPSDHLSHESTKTRQQ